MASIGRGLQLVVHACVCLFGVWGDIQFYIKFGFFSVSNLNKLSKRKKDFFYVYFTGFNVIFSADF